MQLDNPVIYFVKLHTTAAAAAIQTSPFPAAARRGAARQLVGLCGELSGNSSRAVAAAAAAAGPPSDAIPIKASPK